MSKVDKRSRLMDEVFTFNSTKNGLLLLYWQGRLIKTIKGKQAQKLLHQLEGADMHTQQLILAKATGNFKRGNERPSPKD